MTDEASSLIEDSLEDKLRLALIPGIGPRLRKGLLEKFGSARAILAAPRSRLQQVPGVGAKLSEGIVANRDAIDVDAEIDVCRANGVRILCDSEPDYPGLLREIHDPPGVLFVRGALSDADAISIAIVGTRHASSYGLSQAERLASGLSRAGVTVVSGMARGIDAAAHRGALAAGGRTIAVLGSGVLNIYPPEHKQLARDIEQRGAVLSELPPRRQPMSGTFPQRNRIITGLSLGTIIVEAATRSGALISAQHAMEQGREVFAVPGRVDSRLSSGCHRLIRDGAKLVETVDDVLEELGPLAEALPTADGQQIRHPVELKLNEQEQTVLHAIELEPTDINQVIANSQLPAHRVLSTISVLEMRRLVKRVSGNLVQRY